MSSVPFCLTSLVSVLDQLVAAQHGVLRRLTYDILSQMIYYLLFQNGSLS